MSISAMKQRYTLFVQDKFAEPIASGKFGFRLELAYFFAFAYLRLLPNFGIYLGGGTAGLSIVGLALIVLYKETWRMSVSFLTAFIFPLLTVAAIWFIVLGTHPEFWKSNSFFLIQRLIWPAEAILITYLSRRPGFIKRLILMMFFSVLVVMSFAKYSSDKTERLQLATNGFLANSNDFASWTGFCAICLGMWAFNEKRFSFKILLMIASGICIGLIALTVSRASMSLALGMLGLFVILQTFIFRPQMSTVLTLAAAVCVILLMVGVVGIDGFVASYANRANEDSGRERLWSIAVPLIQDHPLGIGDVVLYDPGRHHFIGPHNVFLYLGIIAGWTPMVLTALYYVVCAIKMQKIRLIEGFLWMPGLFMYCILEHNQSNGYIFELWTVVAFVLCIMPPNPDPDAPPPPDQEKRPVVHNLHSVGTMAYHIGSKPAKTPPTLGPGSSPSAP